MKSKKIDLLLLDIFSYSCMNCLRSLKLIKKIDRKYKKYGLKTLIIHPPEWEFEKDSKNIKYASKKYKINIPIKADKNKNAIRKLRINFWPAQILIKNGKVIYEHIGEGSYKNLEKKIILSLKLKPKEIFSKEPKYSIFPTVYCGKRKNGKIMDLRNKLKFGTIYKNGNWLQKDEFLQSVGNDNSLTIITKGRIISFVARSLDRKCANIIIRLDNKYLKTLAVGKPQLYTLIKLKDAKKRELNLIAKSELAVYSFSFQ